MLHNFTDGSADNINATYAVSLSSDPRNDTRKRRVADIVVGDTGYRDQWSPAF